MKKILFLSILFISHLQFADIFNAIEKGELKSVKKYIEAHGDMSVTRSYYSEEQEYEYHLNMFQQAVATKQWDIVVYFVENNSVFHDWQKVLSSGFMISIASQDTLKTMWLYNQGVEINALCDACHGQSAAQIALVYNQVELFYFLIEKGASLDVINNFGQNLLHTVSRSDQVEVATFLLENGFEEKLNLKDDDGDTPLMIAAIHGKKKMFDFLLMEGGLINTHNTRNENLLTYACIGGNLEIVKSVLAIADFDIDHVDEEHMDALNYAVIKGFKDIVEYLIDQGADVNKTSYEGDGFFYPLHIALQEGEKEIAQLLIEKGADICNQKDYLKQSRRHIHDHDFQKYLRTLIHERCH